MYQDRDLLRKICRKDQRGLEEAVNRYAGYLSAVIRRALGSAGNEGDVEELVSDAFLTLWQKAEGLREDSNLKFWLAVVARNLAFKRLGKQMLTEPLEEMNLFSGENLAEDLERREEQLQVRDLVAGMEAVDREIFLRFYFWQEQIDKISRETGLPSSTVKSRLRRGRAKLRKTLGKGGDRS